MKKGTLTSEFWLGLGSGAAALEAGMSDPAWQVRAVAIIAVVVVAGVYAHARGRLKAAAELAASETLASSGGAS